MSIYREPNGQLTNGKRVFSTNLEIVHEDLAYHLEMAEFYTEVTVFLEAEMSSDKARELFSVWAGRRDCYSWDVLSEATRNRWRHLAGILEGEK